ncbi:MAG TPA: glycosyl hydrolase family 18 protein [Thermoleophilaceae bacterium]|nr:glycosyl hydrolase family 18 protein [Thermoleophilaceae bacterium]
MMRRLLPLLVLLAALGAAGPAAAKCPKPGALEFQRKPGNTWGRLSWLPRTGTPRKTSYRVLRNGAVVGQTRRTSMRVRVRIGSRYTLAVRPVDGHGRVKRCSARLQRTIRYVMPSAPGALGVTPDAGGATVRLSWEPARRGDARIVGYRVFRDGAVYGQAPGTHRDIPVSSMRSYTFTVAAVDSAGKLSPEAGPVKVATGHTAPPAPTALQARDVSDAAVTLSWTASVPGRGRVVGYRVYRDGSLVRQVQGTSFRLTNLAAETRHSLSVVAVDGLGYVSAPSAPLAVTTARPVQATGKAHAFLLASTFRSFQDFQAHYRQIDTVHPTYFDCNTSSQLVGKDDPLVTRWAQQRGVKVLARFNCQRSAMLDEILREPGLREYWLSGIADTVERYGYDGASLDFETGYASDRDVYTSFVTDLAQRLHDNGRLLSVAVSPKTKDVANHPRSTFFDYEGLSRAADTVFVMTWGYHWATSGPGPQDDIAWTQKVVNYTATMTNRSRFVVGIQLYGMDWPDGGGLDHPATSYEYADVMALADRTGATPVRDVDGDAMHFSYTEDGSQHEVWYPDARTEGARVRLAQDAGLGIGFWRLGREDQRLWDDPLLAP